MTWWEIVLCIVGYIIVGAIVGRLWEWAVGVEWHGDWSDEMALSMSLWPVVLFGIIVWFVTWPIRELAR